MFGQNKNVFWKNLHMEYTFSSIIINALCFISIKRTSETYHQIMIRFRAF